MSAAELNPESAHPGPLAQPPVKSTTTVLVRVAAVGAIVVMTSFLAYEGRALWHEWTLLQGNLGAVQDTQIVGFRDINPWTSYAAGPQDWFRNEGKQSALWSHWEDGIGHKWFRFPQGEIEQARLRRPPTRYVPRAIDYPVVETNGGEVWKRIPGESQVVGLTLVGLKCVYPVAVLSKVQVVNDLVNDHPYLIAINPFAPANESVSIFEAEVGGHRVTMAPSGYFHDKKPLLYDRGTESLWCETDDGLTAVAGKHRGAHLARVAHPGLVSWSTWQAGNRDSRLLVGADRSRGIPHE
jgi:hypothetical protein